MNELFGLMKAHTLNKASDYCLMEYQKQTQILRAYVGGSVYKYEKGEWVLDKKAKMQ